MFDDLFNTQVPCTHPGEILEDLLSEKSISLEKLQAETGFDEAYIKAVMYGQLNMSKYFSEKLEGATGKEPKFWLEAQDTYDKSIAERHGYK